MSARDNRRAKNVITLDSVVQFNEEYERARQLADEALVRRNTAVQEVLQQGHVRPVEVAERLGVTPGRVSQIAAAARRRGGVAA